MTSMTRASIAAVFLAVTFSAHAGAQARAPEPVLPADPFYLRLLRDGRAELARGAAQDAVADLRLACFGFLDTPPLLAECLVRLALAQAASGDRTGLEQTFGRIAEVEERFSAYTAASLTAEERAAFEEKALALVSPALLAESPGFAAIAARREEEELGRLPERERQRELERRALAQPNDPRWRLALADTELSRSRPARALERLGSLSEGAGDGRVGCLRGEALADLGRWAEALPLLERCGRSATEPRFAGPRRASLAGLARWTEVETFLASLPAALTAKPEIGRLREAIERAQKTRAGRAAEAGRRSDASDKKQVPTAAPVAAKAPDAPRKGAPAPTSAPVRTPAPLADEPVDALSTTEAAALAEAHTAARSARSARELDEALERTVPIADRHPALREPQQVVGEIAYRASRWPLVCEYLTRGGEPGPGKPDLQFYLAVARYETGDREGARAALRPIRQRLERTPYVDSYVRKIEEPQPQSP